MELLDAQAVLNIQQQKRRRGHAERQSGHIDERVDLNLEQVAEGDLEVILKHKPVGCAYVGTIKMPSR
jgi:hypothetical protein